MIASALASSQIGKHTRSRQRLWLQAIETRTGAISETLASIKGLKMLGLTFSISKYLQALREKELEISKRFRKLQISNILMGMPIFPFSLCCSDCSIQEIRLACCHQLSPSLALGLLLNSQETKHQTLPLFSRPCRSYQFS